MTRDRFVLGNARDNAGYVLDGQFHETWDAMDYLRAQGFEESDAVAYLRSLPRDARFYGQARV
jgi:hypothetical protein